MIAQLLERQGIGARVERADALSMSRILGWDIEGTVLVCLCYVANASVQIRYAIRRVRRKTPETPILVALLGDAGEIRDQDLVANTEFVQHSIQAVVGKIAVAASDPSARAEPVRPPSTLRGSEGGAAYFAGAFIQRATVLWP